MSILLVVGDMADTINYLLFIDYLIGNRSVREKRLENSFLAIFCVVLETREAHKDLLQGDLAYGVIFYAILLFGFLECPKHLGDARHTGRVRGS